MQFHDIQIRGNDYRAFIDTKQCSHPQMVGKLVTLSRVSPAVAGVKMGQRVWTLRGHHG